MSHAPRFCRFLLLAGLLLPVTAFAAPFTPAPPFAGHSLPAPPDQALPWTPPAGLPAPLVSAATALFAEGLADPRGGEYRQVSVGVGNAWSGDGGVVRTHAWVLPPAAAGPRFAACWNGLVYPLVSAGDRADLSADVLALVKTDADARAAHDKANPAEPYFRFMHGAIPEYQSVSETSLLPLKAALLVRLGEGDLARKFWDAWLGGTPPRYNDNDEARHDPYLLMADGWVWGLFDRAVTAHMRGDDRLSLLSARQLAALQPVAEAEAARRGYRQSPSLGVHEAGRPYFPYLGPLPRLLADEERRVAAASLPQPALADVLAMPDKGARIAALIRALDRVSARQMSQPGSVSPDADPIVMGLVAQGDDAVQPLIDALAGDPRLTRSVGSGRDFFQERYPVSVAGAAHAALVDILHTSEFGPISGASLDRAGAAALQAYWNKYKSVSAPERWYRTLADDRAAPAQWLDAAHEISRPGNEVAQGGWLVTLPAPAGAAVPPHGEVLRRGHAPSVSALMARRITDIAVHSGAPDNDSRQFNDVEYATTMALYLAAWDPMAARPTLRDQFGAERRALDHWRHGIDVTSNSLNLTRLTLARVHSGDPAALSDYLDWLKVTPLVDFPIFSLSDILEPLWRAPGDPAVARGAAFLFNDPRSPWVPLVQERPGGLYGSAFENLLESPLLGVAGFRRAALAALADRAVLQTVTLGGPDRQADWQIIRHDVGPFRPAAPQAFPVRRCDLYAWHLSHLDGMPAFQYDWPLARKDAAVAAASARLRRYGPRFGAGHPVLRPGVTRSGGPNDCALLQFPRLGRPATAADVARNRAIFTLGAGARAVPLPASPPDAPLPARWVTDRRYPRAVRVWSAARKEYEPGLGYSQDGNVWQAEETAAGKRFYGFVGPHDLARVPAEAMEFPPANSYAWTQVSAGLDCALVGAPGDPQAPPGSLPVAGALTLRLRSRSGLAQTVPADFLRKRLTLTLSFSPDDPGVEPRELRDPSRTWEAVRPRRAPLLPPARALRLAPAQDEAAWTAGPARLIRPFPARHLPA